MWRLSCKFQDMTRLSIFPWELFLQDSHVSLISTWLRSHFVKLSHTTPSLIEGLPLMIGCKMLLWQPLIQHIWFWSSTSDNFYCWIWIQQHQLILMTWEGGLHADQIRHQNRANPIQGIWPMRRQLAEERGHNQDTDLWRTPNELLWLSNVHLKTVTSNRQAEAS